MNLNRHIQLELLRYIVARSITCPATGEVLDVRTCSVLVNGDGDIRQVYAPDFEPTAEAARYLDQRNYALLTNAEWRSAL